MTRRLPWNRWICPATMNRRSFNDFSLYSLRNAIAGSIRAARRAGSEPAPMATITRTPMAAAIVIGSVAVTS
jgi:hypothetical protein